MVCRWKFCPGTQIGCGRRKKKDPKEPEDHALGRSRGGWGSKIHLVSDGRGMPLAAKVTAGQEHETRSFESVMNAVPLPHWPHAVAGDKGYISASVRAWLGEKDIQDVIPTRANQPRKPAFSKRLYRNRNVVERCFGWLKECRRIATRYEKLAVRFLAMIKLAIIREYLKYDLSNTA